MKEQKFGLTTMKKAFGKQNYQIFDDEYKSKLLNHPLINGIYTVGRSFVIVANTNNWLLEVVTGDTVQISGYTKQEICTLGAEFIMNFAIKDHMPMNLATLKAGMDYSNACPVDQRDLIFAVYFYTASKKNGDRICIQHQSIPLVFDEQKIPFIFCNIYTDISYLDAANIPQGMMINKFTREVFHINPKSLGLEKKEEIFSNREKDIIKLLTEGLTSRQIAERLSISKDTVRTHRKNILSKAGISNTASLIKFSIINGVL